MSGLRNQAVKVAYGDSNSLFFRDPYETYINTLPGHNVEHFGVKPGGT